MRRGASKTPTRSVETSGLAPRIPVELQGLVISCLPSSLPFLSSPSLVCRYWLKLSRERLFANKPIILDFLHDEQVKQFQTFVDLASHPSSTFPAHIKIIELRSHFRLLTNTRSEQDYIPLSRIFDAMPHLPGVRTLRLGALAWQHIKPESRNRLPACFPNISELDITDVSFQRFDLFTQLVLGFPSLSRLFLLDLDWTEEERTPILSGAHLSHLSQLHLNGHQTMVLQWLLTSPRQPSISHLVIHSITFPSLPLVNRFLDSVGSSLRSLALDLDPEIANPEINVSRNIYLEELVIDSLYLHQPSNSNQAVDTSWLLRMTEKVAAPLQKLHLEVICDSIKDLQSLEWRTLDDTLMSPARGNHPKAITISLSTSVLSANFDSEEISWEDLESFIAERMPYSAGILQFHH